MVAVDGVDVRFDGEVEREMQLIEVRLRADLKRYRYVRRPTEDCPRVSIEGVRYRGRNFLQEHAHSVVASEVVAQRLVRGVEVNLPQTIVVVIKTLPW